MNNQENLLFAKLKDLRSEANQELEKISPNINLYHKLSLEIKSIEKQLNIVEMVA